jgi:Skp family chaperone for outer membrane proteins
VRLFCLSAAIVLFVSYEGGSAELKTEKASLTIGVVSVRKIFQDCKKHAGYMEEAVAERKSIEAELEKLSKEIEAEKAGLKTLKQGSSDYLLQMKEVMMKQAELQAQQEFYKQQIEVKDQQWTEQLYKDILRQSSEVAKEKDLDLVFERDDVELPATSANELMLTIRTHKC